MYLITRAKGITHIVGIYIAPSSMQNMKEGGSVSQPRRKRLAWNILACKLKTLNS